MSDQTTAFEDSALINPAYTTLVEEAAFLESVAAESGRVSYTSLGPSVNGNPINLVRIGYPLAPTDAEIKEKSVVLIFCGIHGDEISGREATLQHIRNLAFSQDVNVQNYLAKHPLLLIPTLNPDSTDITRKNANDIDLNRDWIAHSQPEILAISAAIRDYDPVATIDFHEMTSGPVHFETLQPTNSSADPDIVAASVVLKEAINAGIVAAGFTVADFDGSDIPVVSRNSLGLANRLAILIEAEDDESHISRKDLVVGQLAILEATRQWHYTNSVAVHIAIAKAKLNSVAEGASQTPISDPPISSPPLGYRLSTAQEAVAATALNRRGLLTFPIEGSSDVYVPMAQAGKNILPFMVASQSSHRLVQADSLNISPVLEPVLALYNTRLLLDSQPAHAAFALANTTDSSALLRPGTTYDFQVQAQEGGELSPWSATRQFTTANAVYGVFNLEWRDTATLTTTTVTGITDLFFDLTGLTASEGYEFRVQETDGTDTSAFSAWTGFTTAAVDVDIAADAVATLALTGEASVTKSVSGAAIAVSTGEAALSGEVTIGGASTGAATTSATVASDVSVSGTAALQSGSAASVAVTVSAQASASAAATGSGNAVVDVALAASDVSSGATASSQGAAAGVVDYAATGTATSALTATATSSVTRNAQASASAVAQALATPSVLRTASGASDVISVGSASGETGAFVDLAASTIMLSTATAAPSKLVGIAASTLFQSIATGSVVTDKVAQGNATAVVVSTGLPEGGRDLVAGFLYAKNVAIFPAFTCYTKVASSLSATVIIR